MVVNDEMPELDKELIILLTSAALVGSSDSEWLGLKCVQTCTSTVFVFILCTFVHAFLCWYFTKTVLKLSEFCSPCYCWQSGT